MPMKPYRDGKPSTNLLFPELSLTGKEEHSINSRGTSSVRQEVLNVLVAQLLKERGIVAAPEQILKDPFGSRRMPDVLVDYQGLRLVIEGEFASPTAHQKASKSALKRVEDGIAHIGMALIYPVSLRDLAPDITRLKEGLAETPLQFAVITESEAVESQLNLPDMPEKRSESISFARGDLNALVAALGRSYEQLLQDRVLERAVEAMENGIGVFLSDLNIQPATTARFASALEIREAPNVRTETGEEDAE